MVLLRHVRELEVERERAEDTRLPLEREAGYGGGPRVSIIDGKQLIHNPNIYGFLTADFYAFDSSLRNGRRRVACSTYHRARHGRRYRRNGAIWKAGEITFNVRSP